MEPGLEVQKSKNMTPFITVTGIKRILEHLGMEIQCGPCGNQHVHTTVLTVENEEIIYSEIQHTESTRATISPSEVRTSISLFEWRMCRAIRMAYHDLIRLQIITFEDLESIPDPLVGLSNNIPQILESLNNLKTKGND